MYLKFFSPPFARIPDKYGTYVATAIATVFVIDIQNLIQYTYFSESNQNYRGLEKNKSCLPPKNASDKCCYFLSAKKNSELDTNLQ